MLGLLPGHTVGLIPGHPLHLQLRLFPGRSFISPQLLLIHDRTPSRPASLGQTGSLTGSAQSITIGQVVLGIGLGL